MNILRIIDKKKNGEALTEKEIRYFIDGFISGEIKDYQASALLMAILLKGMDEYETTYLTTAMIDSGETIDLSSIPGIKSDKHSTGGVGDKTSIALIPLMASCGVKMAKISGRGLGHTGGTLDKLESIPGFKTELTKDEFVTQVKDVGQAIVSQTEDLVYGDKLLYDLRDATSTVDSIPLIASSIMSKKIAAGADTILLDVKYGKGAFMKDMESAKRLAEAMVNIGKNHNKDTQALITNMNQPLGETIGNGLEVVEVIKSFKGEGFNDLKQLVLELGAIILSQNDIEKDLEKGKEILRKKVQSGEVLDSLGELIKAQGGDERVIDNYNLINIAQHRIVVTADRDGYVTEVDPLELGLVSMDLGGGRKKVGDKINHSTGLVMMKKIGDEVRRGDALIEIYYDVDDLDRSFLRRVEKAYKIEDNKPEVEELIAGHIF